MAYLKPPAFAQKVFNPLAMKLGLAGSQTLIIRSRGTGATQRIPVIPIDYGGARYIVSTRGESEWVRNIRAAGTAELSRKSDVLRFKAAEVPVEQRPPIIDAYRQKAGRTVSSYWNKLPDPKDHPVFRLDPLT